MNNSKKNILIITELFPNESYPYLGSFVYNQLDYLKRYYNITLITPRYFGFRIFYPKKKTLGEFTIYSIRQPSLLLSLARKIFNIRRSKIYSWNSKLMSEKVCKIAKDISGTQHFDLVIGHETGSGDIASLVGKMLNIPSVFHLHGLFEYHKNEFGLKKMQDVVLHLEQTQHIISVSRLAINSYHNNGLKNKNISIVPNLVNENRTNSQLDSYWANVVNNRKVVLAISWLNKEKRIDQVIMLAEKIRSRQDTVILIIGEGEEAAGYRKLIKDKHLEKTVYMVGPVSPAQINAFYGVCDFLVHPSIVDSFSMVCLEAMSFGKPIICTKNIGITEYIKNGREGFIIDPDNLQQLFEKTVILLNSAELGVDMGKIAYETSREFSKEIVGEKIRDIYEEQISSQIK